MGAIYTNDGFCSPAAVDADGDGQNDNVNYHSYGQEIGSLNIEASWIVLDGPATYSISG